VQLAIAVSLQELRDCGGIDGLNELSIPGSMGPTWRQPHDLSIARFGKDERVVIEVDADTDELDLEDEPDGDPHDHDTEIAEGLRLGKLVAINIGAGRPPC